MLIGIGDVFVCILMLEALLETGAYKGEVAE